MTADFGLRMVDVLAAGTPISPEAVGTIIGGVIIALIGGGIFGKKVSDSSRTTIDPQPLSVKMEEHFVTRREFDKLETVVAVNATRMESLFERAVNKIEERDERLTATIKETAKNAYEGRARIWKEVNDQGARIKSLDDRNPPPASATRKG